MEYYEMEYLGITEKYLDLAGKWRVRVNLGEEAIVFRFDSEPSDALVEEKSNEYIQYLWDLANSSPPMV